MNPDEDFLVWLGALIICVAFAAGATFICWWLGLFREQSGHAPVDLITYAAIGAIYAIVWALPTVVAFVVAGLTTRP